MDGRRSGPVRGAPKGGALRSRHRRADHRLSSSQGVVRARGRALRVSRRALDRRHVRGRQSVLEYADEAASRLEIGRTGARLYCTRRLMSQTSLARLAAIAAIGGGLMRMAAVFVTA